MAGAIQALRCGVVDGGALASCSVKHISNTGKSQVAPFFFTRSGFEGAKLRIASSAPSTRRGSSASGIRSKVSVEKEAGSAEEVLTLNIAEDVTQVLTT